MISEIATKTEELTFGRDEDGRHFAREYQS